MDGGRFGLALTAGMVASVNPCGLPMLPAYLSAFITGDDDAGARAERRAATSLAVVRRALTVSATVSAGFMAVFGTAGALVSWVTRGVYDVTPWATVVVGLALVVVGVLLLSGRQVNVALPKLDRGGRDGGLWSMFVFGISYAIASVSCTLPVFLPQVSSSLGQSVGRGVAIFGTYALGMALVLMALSVSLALARTGLINALRASLRIINRVAGALLVVAGAYFAWYGWYEIRADTAGDPAVDRVTGWSADLSNLVSRAGPYRVASMLGLVIIGAVGVSYLRSAKRDTTSSSSSP